MAERQKWSDFQAQGKHHGKQMSSGSPNDTDYFDEQGRLRPENFYEWPNAAVKRFERNDKRTALRKLYDWVAATKERLSMPGEDHVAVLREGLGGLRRFAAYQSSRGIISADVLSFVNRHCEAVGEDTKKFRAFYEQFQGIMAYLPK